ncbi:unnamed protein product [Ilex paraguariensis]|uniref:Uncharacterized protein n=1 Tax=Ilex paraguariensis TaxID=185542 RepID=A0ABC8V536_9AQUA
MQNNRLNGVASFHQAVKTSQGQMKSCCKLVQFDLQTDLQYLLQGSVIWVLGVFHRNPRQISSFLSVPIGIPTSLLEKKEGEKSYSNPNAKGLPGMAMFD